MNLPARALALALSAAPVRPFFEPHLPEALLRSGPRGFLWWQWLAFPVLVAFALAAGSVLGWATRRVLGHLASRTRSTWDDELVERLATPLSMLWAIGVVTALHPWLSLGEAPEDALQRTLRGATYLALFWAGFRSVDVAFSVAGQAPWTRTSPSLAGFLPFARKI